jgi:SnoaL-like domain
MTARTPVLESMDRLPVNIVESFVEAYNTLNMATLRVLLDEQCMWDDYEACYNPIAGMDAIERFLRLQKANGYNAVGIDSHIRIDEVVVGDAAIVVTDQSDDTWGFTFSNSHATSLFRGRGAVVLQLRRGKIHAVSMVREKPIKLGRYSLIVLSVASRILKMIPTGPHETSTNDAVAGANAAEDTPLAVLSLPEQYFAAWNRRDISTATSLFTSDAVYDDTAFARPLQGRDQVEHHLRYCADCLPPAFAFVVDSMVKTVNRSDAPAPSNLMATWHVENNGQALPFSRGISFYELCPHNKAIRRGIDFVDSEPIKVSGTLGVLQRWLSLEPVRWIPLVTWLAYMYIVFLSDGILPGANALELEQRTWAEVADLSLNFFLVAPILNLPFSPVVHPMLEGVFNLLLSWAAMFAGFLSDERRSKPNLLPMLPTVAGMQFLTSAFLLPYLATRTSEHGTCTWQELPVPARIAETRILGPGLAIVGSYSVAWALFGRWAEFGDWSSRLASFGELLSIDRVGCSFLVDLVIFAVFQGWMVDDDLQRRGVDRTDFARVRLVGKYVPFLGLALYLLLRPPFPHATTDQE